MIQRIPRRAWQSAAGAAHRPRLLIEDDHPALAISDFSIFEQAGFDVAFCSGPGDDPTACPVLRGGQCRALDGADVVLHGLDPRLGVARSIRQYHPGMPVVIQQHRRADGSCEPIPVGCIPLAPECSVPGQVKALRRVQACLGARSSHGAATRGSIAS